MYRSNCNGRSKMCIFKYPVLVCTQNYQEENEQLQSKLKQECVGFGMYPESHLIGYFGRHTCACAVQTWCLQYSRFYGWILYWFKLQARTTSLHDQLGSQFSKSSRVSWAWKDASYCGHNNINLHKRRKRILYYSNLEYSHFIAVNRMAPGSARL